MRLVAGRELADDRPGLRVDDVHLARGRGGHQQPLAVRRDRHVVGPVALDLHAPDDAPVVQADGNDIGEARAGDEHQPPVRRGEGVVDVLVVALADELADAEEVAVVRRVGLDLGHPLRDVRDDVDALQPRVALRVDHVGRAVPVVGHHEHGTRLLLRRDGRPGRREHHRHCRRDHQERSRAPESSQPSSRRRRSISASTSSGSSPRATRRALVASTRVRTSSRSSGSSDEVSARNSASTSSGASPRAVAQAVARLQHLADLRLALGGRRFPAVERHRAAADVVVRAAAGHERPDRRHHGHADDDEEHDRERLLHPAGLSSIRPGCCSSGSG